MGNKLCKKKSTPGDVLDNGNLKNLESSSSPSKFDRIINRLHLKPAAWKSDSNLSKKDTIINRSKSEEGQKNVGDSIFYTTKPLSKSSDWTQVDLEVPLHDDDEDSPIHLRNPKLDLIFDNNNKGTPTPPPRKQNKSNFFKDKFGKIATKSLQAFQISDKIHKTINNNADNRNNDQIPVEEPLIIKKKINYNCPLCEKDEKNHNRDHHHNHTNNKEQNNVKKPTNKRQKNLSVISLPNYSELKLTVAPAKNELNSSRLSLQQHGNDKKLSSSQSTGKLDSYITRCRSFGSIFPQQLKKLKIQKTKPEDIISDDSFGPLEDWDVGLIEHYNPRDTSLPRPRKSSKDVLAGIEDLIIKTEEINEEIKPQRPLRRSESLVKKVTNNNNETILKNPEEICLTPPPSPSYCGKVAAISKKFQEPSSSLSSENHQIIKRNNSVAEHSSLMRILQEFSVKDAQEKSHNINNKETESNLSSLTPSLVEFEKTFNNIVIEDFLNAEKNHTNKAACN